PGDKVLFYLTGQKAFGGTAELTSHTFESTELIWACSKDDVDEQGNAKDPYLYRFHSKPLLIPKEDELLPVEPYKEQITYLQKWPAKNWTLGFQGNLHQWPKQDFERIEAALKSKNLVTV